MTAPAVETSVRRPLLVLTPTRGWLALNLRDIWQFRDLLFSLAGRDLKLRYKQTALGAAWVVLQPLLAAGIFSFVFGTVFGLSGQTGRPYFLISFAGLLGWNLFSSTVTKISGCLIGNSGLISKVFFPRLVLPLSSVPSVMVDFAVAAALMAILLVVYRVPPTWAVLLLPVWIGVLLLAGIGAGLIAASLSVSYRDVQYILPVMMQSIFYASPIAYPLSKVPAKYLTVYLLNPLSGPLEAFRSALLGTDPPPVASLFYAAAVGLVLFFVGAFGFKRMERQFADVI